MKRRILLYLSRILKNYTSDYMANQLGITRAQYSNIENGKTNSLKESQKKKISELLNIDEELIDLEEDKIVICNNQVGMQSGENNQFTNHFMDEKMSSILEQQQRQIEILNQTI